MEKKPHKRVIKSFMGAVDMAVQKHVTITIPSEDTWTCKLRFVLASAEMVFESFKHSDFSAIEDRIKRLSPSYMRNNMSAYTNDVSNLAQEDDNINAGGGGIVDMNADINMDEYLSIVIQEWGLEIDRRSTYCTNLFASINLGSGRVNASEFAAACRNINIQCDDNTSTRIYRDASQLAKAETANAGVFCDVLNKYGLLDKWWRPGGSMYSTINGLTELSNTWRKTSAFVAGTLSALVRNLPATHKLKLCKAVGDGCLKCIQSRMQALEHMIVNRKIDESEVTQEDCSREWQTFWVLMQDLQRASSQSNSQVTLYDNSVKLLTKEAKQLSSRNTNVTQAAMRKRRNATPLIFIPDDQQLCATTSNTLPDLTGLRDRRVSRYNVACIF